MTPNRLFKGLSFASAVLITALGTHSAFAQRVESNIAPGTKIATDLGAADPAKNINITVHLKLSDKAAFDKAVDDLYIKGSPTYHKWMTDEDLQKYAPTEAQRQAVVKELERNGLTVLPSFGATDFTVRAHGTIASVSNAFNTQVHEFSHNGRSFRANVYEARLNGEAANYVAGVSGIESHQMRSQLVRAVDKRTGQPYAPIPLAKIAPAYTPGVDILAAYSTTTCLTGPVATKLQYGNVPPVADYVGNLYDPPLPCDYTPQQLQAVYHLSKAYSTGFDGTGQTVVIVDAYGSPTILADAALFSQLAGLPPINLTVIQPQGPTASNPGWAGETTLDVEWAHSIAPGAKIVLIETSSNEDVDLQAGITYAATHHLGNSCSNSYGSDDGELYYSPQELQTWDSVIAFAVAQGISVNFATGDLGDGGLGSPVGAAGVPSESPHATAVGGTSIINVPGKAGQTATTGWGTTFASLSAFSNVLDPPQPGIPEFGISGFYFGGGGGESIFFPKPSWQSTIPGTGRQTPDISALADPYTGVPIVITQGGAQYLESGNGGTSLATPIFSAMWAIGNQYAGFPLGQAAPYIAGLYNAHVPYIQDVLPTNPASAYNVHGTVYDLNGAHTYSSTAIYSSVLEGNTGFTTAIFPLDPGDIAVISFGLDTSLTVTPGWDNVTGYGTPNPGAMGGSLIP